MEQVHSYEEAKDDEPGFSTSPCMMALVEMSKGKKLMNRKSELTKKRKMRCGNCDKCIKVDCDYCTDCQGMTKFGGNGRPTKLSISSLPVISQSLSSKLPKKSSLSTLNVTLCLVVEKMLRFSLKQMGVFHGFLSHLQHPILSD